MWEISVSISKENCDYLLTVQNNLQKYNVFSAVCNLNNQSILSIAAESPSDILLQEIFDKVAEVIIYIYKNKFLKDNLNLNKLDKLQKSALLKALLLFDIESDKEIIKKQLSSIKNIVIDSLYKFKLKPLKNKWKELCSIANENNYFIFENESFLELLKFIIESIETKTNSIDIYFNGIEYILCNQQNEKLVLPKEDGELEVNLVTNLIDLAPKIINVHCSNSISNNTYKIMSYIFDKKINLLV